MDVVQNLNTEFNFWTTNPQLKIPEIFNKLYKADKSKNKDQSSKLMWSFFLLVHPDSAYKNLPIKKREDIIIKEYIKDKDFKFSEYREHLKLVEDLTLTPAKRQLKEWSRILDEKSAFMESTTYNEENWEMLESMMKSNSTLYKEHDRIREALDREGTEGIVKGNSIESAQEKELI